MKADVAPWLLTPQNLIQKKSMKEQSPLSVTRPVARPATKSVAGAVLGCLFVAACGGKDTPPPTAITTPQNTQTSPTSAQGIPENAIDRVFLTSADIQNRTAAEIQDIYGTPDLVRRDGPVHIMVYWAKECVLDLTLTEKSAQDYYRLTHIAARTKDGHDIDPNGCLTQYER